MIDEDPPVSPASIKFPSDTALVKTQHPYDAGGASSSNNNNASGNDVEAWRDEDSVSSQFELIHDNTQEVEGRTRKYSVQIVTGLKDAMDPRERRRKEFAGLNGLVSRPIIVKKDFKKQKGTGDKDNKSPLLPVSDATMLGPGTQFRLRSMGGSRTQRKQQTSYDPSSLWAVALGFVDYVQWTYKVSLWKVMGSLIAFFLAFVTFFSISIFAVGKIQPNCLHVGTSNFEKSGSYFIDAFQISWTTFSTVGYGATGPSVSSDGRCFSVSIFAAIEAFLGVLYAGVAGAIMTGKIMRYIASASVSWSDPIILRYGGGVHVEMNESNNIKSDTEVSKHGDDKENWSENNCPIPYPLLEFRVINEAFARDGGEIANAKVQVWASILEKDASYGLRDAVKANSSAMSRQQRRRNEGGIRHAKQKATSKGDKPAYQLRDLKKSAGGTMGGVVNSMAKQVGNVSKTGLKTRGTVGGYPSRVSRQFGGQILSLCSNLPKDLVKSFDGKLHEKSHLLENISEISTIDDLSSTEHASVTGVEEGTVTFMGEGDSHFHSSAGFLMTTDSTTSLDGAFSDPRKSRPACVMMDEGDLSPATIYTRLKLENGNHPFFKRVWTLRHKLDFSSPLLNHNACGIIQQFHASGGTGWPPQLNSYKKLRETVKFEDISVTLAGRDHVTGHVVFGNTSYTSQDLVIGYQFANILVQSEVSDGIRVDRSLLNDVMEQHGGGAEPLIEEARLEPPLTVADITIDIENQIPELNISESEFDFETDEGEVTSPGGFSF